MVSLICVVPSVCVDDGSELTAAVAVMKRGRRSTRFWKRGSTTWRICVMLWKRNLLWLKRGS